MIRLYLTVADSADTTGLDNTDLAKSMADVMMASPGM